METSKHQERDIKREQERKHPQDENVQFAFEEYKMFYESAEKVTERRLSTNRWYYSICTGILSACALIMNWITTNPGFLIPAVLLVGVLCGMAVLFCIYWIAQINDFKMLNKAKFSVINEMAPHVSFSPEPSDTRVSCLPFEKEWDQLKESKAVTKSGPARILALRSSSIEYLIPKAFMGLFSLIIIGAFLTVVLNWNLVKASSPLTIKLIPTPTSTPTPTATPTSTATPTPTSLALTPTPVPVPSE